jgi:hypothetical protein
MTEYEVRFSEEAKDYRIGIITLLDDVELCEYPDGRVYIRCPKEMEEAIEYELRKAERRDDYCEWERIR